MMNVDDNDDDLYDEDELDEESEDDDSEKEKPEPVVEDKPKPAKKAKPAAAPVVEDTPDQAQLAEFGLNALKQSFVEAARTAGFVAADFEGIGLKGIDDAAKAAFIAEAEASHTQKVEALAAQGFVYNPEAAGAAGKEAQIAAEEAAQKEAWGKPGPGLAATGSEKFAKEVEDEVASGDTMGVIGTLLGKGKLGEFFVSGKRG